MKIILDTDIGYDPDDLFALILLDKLARPQLKLIVTSDEVNGKRATFAKRVLNLLGNTTAAVVEGSNLGLNNFVVDELIEDIRYQKHDTNFLRAMKRVIDAADLVTYIGIGGFTNLAKLIKKCPESKDKVNAFLMGGAIGYEWRPEWIEHNVRIDPDSAKTVIESGWKITLVMAQTTYDPNYAIGEQDLLYKKLRKSNNSVHQLAAKHCKLWYDLKHLPATNMHDPLTVVTALGKDFVKLNTSNVSVSPNGAISLVDTGFSIKWSDLKSKSAEFMEFLEKVLF